MHAIYFCNNNNSALNAFYVHVMRAIAYCFKYKRLRTHYIVDISKLNMIF